MLQIFMKCKFMHTYFVHIHIWFVAFKKLQVLLTSWRLFLFQVSAFLLEFMFWKAKSREHKVWSKFRQEYLLLFNPLVQTTWALKSAPTLITLGDTFPGQICTPKSKARKHLLKELDKESLRSTSIWIMCPEWTWASLNWNYREFNQNCKKFSLITSKGPKVDVKHSQFLKITIKFPRVTVTQSETFGFIIIIWHKLLKVTLLHSFNGLIVLEWK